MSICAGTSICWDCGNACGNGCEWSAEGKPVPGWKAYQRDIKGMNKETVSYCVTNCPKFTRKENKLTAETVDEDGAIKLLEAVCALAGKDYIEYPDLRLQIEAWMEGCDWIIKELRRAVKDQPKADRYWY